VPPPNMKAVCTAGGDCEVAIDNGCALTPRTGCCFGDTQCAGRCYGATCSAGSEGVCKAPPVPGQCWGDQDCANGQTCAGARICPCASACLLSDAPGNCH
jgi:hypothetical protein